MKRSTMARRLAPPLFLLVAIITSAADARGQDPNPVEWLVNAGINSSSPKPTIVLVRSPSSDAIGLQNVVPILQKDGYKVIAVENRLSSLAEDVATTKKVIDAAKGRVVLVGHSYGGAVITGVAAGNPKVKALVYVAAFAPDANEPVGAFNEKYPSAPGSAPVANPAVLGQSIAFPAWRTIRSWYFVSPDDQAINPDLQRFFAKRMGARPCEIKRGHAPVMTPPKTVARCIEEAAITSRSDSTQRR